MHSTIPLEVRRLILTSVPSIPYLEALLLLRNEPDLLWTSVHLAERLYVSDKIAKDLLAELTSFGVAEESFNISQKFQFKPRSDELRGLLDQLADTYSHHLLEVTHLIHSTTNRKAHQFADAFKLRKDS